MRQPIAILAFAVWAFGCVPDPLNAVGFSDDFHDVSPPESRPETRRPKEVLAPLTGFGKLMFPRFWAEGHSYRRFTIEVWGNEAARNSTQSGGPATIGSEFIATHFVDEKGTTPVMFFAMRKETQDGGNAWVYRAYDSDREAMVLDAKPCEGCHAMARSDSRFTFAK